MFLAFLCGRVEKGGRSMKARGSEYDTSRLAVQHMLEQQSLQEPAADASLPAGVVPRGGWVAPTRPIPTLPHSRPLMTPAPWARSPRPWCAHGRVRRAERSRRHLFRSQLKWTARPMPP